MIETHLSASEVEALFAQTLLGDYEAKAAWEAISVLRLNGNRQIFEQAASWCLADDPLKRARAVDVLSQLKGAQLTNAAGTAPEEMFRGESYLLVTEMLECEQHPVVLASAIFALGHLNNANAVPLILRYRAHPDKNVRFAVCFALGCFPDDSQSVSGLLKLTSDADADIRDWAVFGLGVQGNADSMEIREVLLRCLEDANDDVREEAAVGLGKRRDERLVPNLLAMLGQAEVTVRVAEAAAALLGLDQDPPGWNTADYKAALLREFQIPD